MKVRVASYGSNEQDIAVLAPVGNTLENRLKIILSLVLLPEYEMSLDMFQKLLNQIELSGPY